MRRLRPRWALLVTLIGIPLLAQEPGPQSSADEPVVVSSEHPRLFLRPGRLRLLKRERQRTSMRWQQFETLMAGHAVMPEPGFADALYYQVTGDAAAGRRAVAWALGPAGDLRQQALVFDWCQELMSDAQQRDLAARMVKGIAATAADDSIPAARSRVLAAVALFDHTPNVPRRELERIVRIWWGRKVAPALVAGRSVVARDDAYALFELLHAMRDNTTIDLRELSPQFFKDFPIEHLMSYYPAPVQAAENEYRIGVMRKPGEPDFRAAALSRAAELAMVAYDVNAAPSQVLQGWLMHDNFILRGTFGAPYEFLWANPYQPGLSYYHVPLIYHNPESGRLFVRSDWENSASWFGDFDGVLQTFAEGRPTNIDPQRPPAPLYLKEAVVCFGQTTRQYHVKLEEEDAVFIVGLEPGRTYLVEVDDEEVSEETADPGGILELTDVPHGKEVGIRIAPGQSQAAPTPGQGEAQRWRLR
jgi:hypothetical protein